MNGWRHCKHNYVNVISDDVICIVKWHDSQMEAYRIKMKNADVFDVLEKFEES